MFTWDENATKKEHVSLPAQLNFVKASYGAPLHSCKEKQVEAVEVKKIILFQSWSDCIYKPAFLSNYPRLTVDHCFQG